MEQLSCLEIARHKSSNFHMNNGRLVHKGKIVIIQKASKRASKPFGVLKGSFKRPKVYRIDGG